MSEQRSGSGSPGGGRRTWLASRLARIDGPGREPGVDLARGLAVIGMFAAHLLDTVPWVWADPATWTDVVNGRSSILFAMLAGVSIGLVTGRTEPLHGGALAQARGRLAVRAAAIWFLGILLVLLQVPVYVILPAYGILFLLVLPLLRLPARWLLPLAAVLALGMPFAQFAIDSSPMWSTPGGVVLDVVIGWHYPFVVWIAFVVAGLGIARLRLSRPVTAGCLVLVGAVLAIDGYALIGTAGAGAPESSLLGFVTSADPHTSGIGEVVGSGGIAIAVIGACVLVCRTPLRWVVLPLRATGAMALTAYAAQLVVWAVLQPAPAPGETTLTAFRALEPFWPFALGTLVLCTAWTLLIGRGPLEWAVARLVALVGVQRDRAPRRGSVG